MDVKLQIRKTNSKSYWYLLKIFLNNKKIPLIPQLFHSNPINNNSKRPKNLNHVTDRRLSSVTFSTGDIGKISQNLNSNKEHDMTISVFGC